MERNGIFEEFQSRFKVHGSIETALVKVINDLIAFDSELISMLVLLNLSVGFNTADHIILIQRLECIIGIKGTTL